MPMYISLIQYTQQGIEAIKGSPQRLDDARTAFEAAGAKLKEFYLVMGEYDLVIIAEAPSDEVMARLMLAVGAKGNARTRTMPAFAEPDLRRIIGSLP